MVVNVSKQVWFTNGSLKATVCVTVDSTANDKTYQQMVHDYIFKETVLLSARKPVLITPEGWLLLLKLTVLSWSAIVV